MRPFTRRRSRDHEQVLTCAEAELALHESDRLEKLGVVGCPLQPALEQLQLQTRGVERVANLVREAGRERTDGGELLGDSGSPLELA